MSAWVALGSRRFLVDFDQAGAPLRIKERKVLHAGHPYLEHVYNAPYWSAAHHKLGGPKTLPARIIAAALEKELGR